jgi:hypothetical protein
MDILLWLWQRMSSTFWSVMPARWRPEEMVLAAKGKTEAATEKYEPSRWMVGLWWLLHLVIVAVVVFGLWYVNSLYDLDKVLRSPWPWLHKFWLPLLFLLGYALCWLGWYLWKLLGPERETQSYTDIDEAWAEAVIALKEAGIEIAHTPLYLIIGRPSGSVDDLFYASQLPLQVRTVPRRAEAPLHVYANKEAIYVTCEGASLLGRTAELLTAKENVSSSAVNMTLSPAALAGRLLPELLQSPTPAAEKPVKPATDADATLESKPETSVAELLLPEPSGRTASFVTYRQPLRLLQNIDETERLTARLKYLCRKIARQRHPYCSVNGLLILTPLAATDNDADAHQTGLVIQRDVRAARESLRVRCPIETVLCDLERLPGFLDLMGQFTEERQRQQLLGRTFPLVPQIEPEQFPKMISGGLEWLCQTMLPSVVYQFLQTEKSGDASPEETLRRNARLVYLLGQLRDRQPRWSHILTQGVTVQEKQMPLLGGAFLCATGPDAAREQAFVHDVFSLLLENQNYVTWTPEALDENRDYLRWARLCYVGIALLTAGFVFLAYHIWVKV